MVYKAVKFRETLQLMLNAYCPFFHCHTAPNVRVWLAGVTIAASPAEFLRCSGFRRKPGPPGGRRRPAVGAGFWDPRRRPERPDLSRLTVIRFLTETDYPPFNYAGPDGNPAGFNVDLARMICEELKVACTIQMRRFDTLVPRSTTTAATP